MKILWAALAAILLLGAHGVAAAPAHSISRPVAAKGPSLRGSTLYIYTFIDVRETEFGPKVINEFDSQLISRFGTETVQANVLRFSSTRFAGQNSYRGGAMSGYNVIPVERVIASNWKAERESGARYRLIVVPSNYQITGAWQSYQLRWVLFDIQTNEKVWDYLYSGKHLMMMRRDENAAKRAKKFIDKAFVEMKKGGLI